MNNYPVSGMKVEEAEEILHQKRQLKEYDGQQFLVVEDLSKGVTAFITNEKVKIVYIRAPFKDEIKGVHISDTEAQVRKILGKPIEEWEPVPGTKWMTYSHKPLLRVDLNTKAGNIVDRIYV